MRRVAIALMILFLTLLACGDGLPRISSSDLETDDWSGKDFGSTDLKDYVGPKGRTHVFTPEGKHHTSFRTSNSNRAKRVRNEKWTRVK